MKNSTNFMQPDVTLNLDVAGIIQRAVLANAIADQPIAEWVGKAWVDTVGAGHGPVQRMLDDAQMAGVSAFQWVHQRFPSGLELPIEYTTVRLGGSAGLIAIGRSLEAVEGLRAGLAAAKLTMERDAWKMRGVETRRRLLFNATVQPSLMISANDFLVTDANRAATDALGVAVGSALMPSPEEQSAFHAMLASVRTNGTAPALMLHLGAERTGWLVRASLASDPADASDAKREVILLRLSPAVTSSTSATSFPTSGFATSQAELKERSRAAARELIRGKVAAVEAQVADVIRELTQRTRKS